MRILDSRSHHRSQAADVYVMPYREARNVADGGGAMSMAMAAGLPVVATPFEHARQVVGGGLRRLDELEAGHAPIYVSRLPPP